MGYYGWDDEPDEEYLKLLPVCERCEEPIFEYYYKLPDGNYCQECLEVLFMKSVDSYIEEHKDDWMGDY